MFKQKNLVSLLLLIVAILLVAILINQRKDTLVQDQSVVIEDREILEQEEESLNLEQAIAPVPGANKVLDEIVVTDLGEPVDIASMPNDPKSPTAVSISKRNLPETAINIDIRADRFHPSSFTVKSGQPVSLAFTSNDRSVHVITFEDSSLASLAFAVGPRETKAITFNAPSVPGTYKFQCDVPGHAEAGEVGYMIVE